MKQQILWVVEYFNRRKAEWMFDEVCFSRKAAREAAAACRHAGMQVRVVKYIREA